MKGICDFLKITATFKQDRGKRQKIIKKNVKVNTPTQLFADL